MTQLRFNDYTGLSINDFISKMLLVAKSIRMGADIYKGAFGDADIYLKKYGWAGTVGFSHHLDQFVFGDKDGIPNQNFNGISLNKNGGSFTYSVSDIVADLYEFKALNTADKVVQFFFSGDDIFKGGDSADVIHGYSGDDSLEGFKGNDRLYGDAGDDMIYGFEGNDTLYGGSGGDFIEGGTGDDELFGGAGDDTLWGQGISDGTRSGDDILNGGSGNDRLVGGYGRDKLYGGTGQDRLEGGKGADTFIYKSISETKLSSNARDNIEDFSRGQGDRIDLSAIDANTGKTGNQAFSFIGSKGFSKVAGELRYEKDDFGVVVLGDVNGDGRADFSIHCDSMTGLKQTDFLL